MQVDSRAEAIQKVRDGDVLGAIIIPEDLTAEAAVSGSSPGRSRSSTTRRIRPSASSWRTRSSPRCRRANAALTKRIAEEALDLLELISDGGEYRFLGQDVDVLGLSARGAILREARSASCRRARRSASESTR